MAIKISDLGTQSLAGTQVIAKANGTTGVATKSTLSELAIYISQNISSNSITPTELNVSGNGVDGQVLTSDGLGGFTWENAGAGGSTTLAGLTDVDTTGVIQDSILKYNAISGQWEIGVDQTGGGGSTTLAGLTDVDTTGAVNNSVLKYNSTSGNWEIGVDETASGGGVTSISVGTGLDIVNATTTPNITLDLSEFTSTTTLVGTDEFIVLDGTLERKIQASNINLSIFNNDLGLGGGDITSVTAGNGLTGGGVSGAVTLNVGGSSTITVGANDISVTANSIGASQLNVVGNGTAGQVLTSDGDGSFSWNTVSGGGTVDVVSNVAQNTILGRVSAGTGDSQELTPAQVRTLINVADGATANSTDAFLLDRTNHTGTQAISTITNLQTELNNKLESSDLVNYALKNADNNFSTNQTFQGSLLLDRSTKDSAIITANNGEVLLIGTNFQESGVGDTTNDGAYIKFDTRDSGLNNLFSLNYQQLGTTLNNQQLFTINSSGDVTANNFILSSDARLKKNVNEITEKIDVDWKAFEFKNQKGKRYGVIAQDLEKKYPQFVNTDSNGFKSVKYIDLLVAKVSELENEIKALKRK